MSAQNDERPGFATGAKLWTFLNSGFGLFLLSSVFLSLVTWMYTEASQHIEQRIHYAEMAKNLDTEIQYRIRLMNNYFQSDCADHKTVDRATIKDIQDIYRADEDFRAIFDENRGKELHILIWERAALLEVMEKRPYVNSFNELTIQFNAYLTRILRQTENTPGWIYGKEANYGEEVAELTRRFKSAIDPIFPDSVTLPVPSRKTDSEVPDGNANFERIAAGKVRIDPKKANADADDVTPAFDFGDAVPSRLPMDGSMVSPLWASETIAEKAAIDEPFLMPIDYVMSSSGRGTMVTGRVERGIVKLGEELEIVGLARTRKATVTSIEAFRKLLEEGSAGESIGLVLADTRRNEVERGQVLAEPGSIKPHTSFLAEAYFLTAEEGGRHKPFFKGYRPQFRFRTTDVTGAVELPEDTKKVIPGAKVQMKVDLIAPIAMEPGLRFDIREGGRRVGAGLVYEILE